MGNSFSGYLLDFSHSYVGRGYRQPIIGLRVRRVATIELLLRFDERLAVAPQGPLLTNPPGGAFEKKRSVSPN